MKGNNIQLENDFHKEIVEFCKREGYSFNGLVKALLRKKIDGEI